MENQRSAEVLHKTAVELAQRIRNDQMKLGELYDEVLRRKIWREVKDDDGQAFEGKADYFKKSFGICASGAERYAKVWRTFSNLKFKGPLLPARSMYWLTYVVVQSNVDEWLSNCVKKSHKEIERMVRREIGDECGKLGARGRDRGQSVWFSAAVNRDDSATIEEAIVKVMKEECMATRGEALAFMAEMVNAALSPKKVA